MLRLPISWQKGSAVDSRFLTRPDERLGQIQILHQQRGNCFSAWTLPQRNPVRKSCAASPGRQASNGDLAVAHHERTGRFGPAPLAGPKRVRCARLTKSPQAALARHQRAKNAPLLPGRSESVVRGSQKSAQAALARHQRARNAPLLPGRSESVVRGSEKSPQAAQARHQLARNAPLLPGRSESVVRGSEKSPQAAQSKPPCDYSPQANEKRQRSTTTAPCSQSKLREHRHAPTALSTPRQFPRTPANRTSERLQLQD
jgi:hypothetical protein